MDITPTSIAPPPATVAAAAAVAGGVKTPEGIPPGKPLNFSNGVLKRYLQIPPPAPAPATSPAVVYRECLKNHAAAMGGHAVDGCGEFMPSPDSTPSDPTSLKCAACSCHRNFHRRDPDDLSPSTLHPSSAPNHHAASAAATAQHVIEYQPHHRHHPPPPPPRGGVISSPNSPSPPPISSSYYPSAPHMLLALSAAGGHNPTIAATAGPSRKRFRTKFTVDQKDKMHEFAEKVGWKVQRRDEEMIAEFCREVGVERGVLKVWMHNNKNTLGKKVEEETNQNNNHNHNHNTNGFGHENPNLQNPNNNHNHNHFDDEEDDHVVATTNGSSSSS